MQRTGGVHSYSPGGVAASATLSSRGLLVPVEDAVMTEELASEMTPLSCFAWKVLKLLRTGGITCTQGAMRPPQKRFLPRTAWQRVLTSGRFLPWAGMKRKSASLTVLGAGPQLVAVPGARGRGILHWRGQGAICPLGRFCVETAHRRGAARGLAPEGLEQLPVGQLHVLEECGRSGSEVPWVHRGEPWAGQELGLPWTHHQSNLLPAPQTENRLLLLP